MRYTPLSMDTLAETVKKTPTSPGVYIFRNANHEVLYVGKAIHLRRRVKQYFEKKKDVSPKISLLVPQIAHLETIQAISEFDALILEAKLIRQYQPKFNSIAKDDKSPLYIALSKENLARVSFVRKSDIQSQSVHNRDVFGPFPSKKVAQSLLKKIRRSIPFCMQKQRNGKPCFYAHIGLCQPCPSEIHALPLKQQKTETRIYQNHIRQLRLVLSGNSIKLRNTFLTRMNELAQQERFEEASIVREQIQSLNRLHTIHFDPMQYINQDAIMIHDLLDERTVLTELLQPWFPQLKLLSRIECFDISHTYGTFPVASMVVLHDGIPQTGEYRRFAIKTVHAIDDARMMAEVVTRRMKHSEWKYPDLIVVDGGKQQVKTIFSLPSIQEKHIPVIGLAKRREQIILYDTYAFHTITLPLANKALHIIERIRDEAHRFAITYHKNRRKKAFLP